MQEGLNGLYRRQKLSLTTEQNEVFATGIEQLRVRSVHCVKSIEVVEGGARLTQTILVLNGGRRYLVPLRKEKTCNTPTVPMGNHD